MFFLLIGSEVVLCYPSKLSRSPTIEENAFLKYSLLNLVLKGYLFYKVSLLAQMIL